MRWSWRLLKVAGIGIYIHVTFFLLLGWVAWSNYVLRHEWEDALSGVAFIVTLFVIVVLHELGHALTARRFGIQTRDITLLPIGGVARLERMPEDPKEELAVALAGPAVNVLLALLLFSVLGMRHQLSTVETFTFFGRKFPGKVDVDQCHSGHLQSLACISDGRRACIARFAGNPVAVDVRATNIAANIGQGMALLFRFFGLLVIHF